MTSTSSFPHWAIKVIGTAILFLLSILLGYSPVKLAGHSGNSSPTRNLLISLSNCFAGGVFFSTVILDLLPMVKVKMHNALLYVDIETDFPAGEFLVGVGFIMMLILEQFVNTCCKNSIFIDGGHGHAPRHSGYDNICAIDGEDDSASNDNLINDDEGNAGDNDYANFQESRSKKHVSVGNTAILHGKSISDDEDDFEKSQESVGSRKSGGSYETYFSRNGTHHRVPRMYRTKSLASMQSVVHSNFRTYVLVFAISLHSIFEGVAVGLILKTEDLIQIFIALFIHKSIISFSIGVQLVDADLRRKVIFICLLIFAAMAPIGVGLGLAVMGSFNTTIKLFFSGILQAIATGTFLYVTFFEVLPHELAIQDDKKSLKILFVILGYAVITAICSYENGFHRIRHIKPDNGTHMSSLEF